MRVPKNSSRSARVEAALWAARHEAECNSQKTRDTVPAPFLLRAGAEGTQRQRHCTNATPIFFPEKENGRRPSKRKAFRLAVSILNGLYASGMEVPARHCRVGCCYTIWCASTIRCCAAVGGSAALRMRHTPCGCRSAYLVVVQPNSRLPPVSTIRRAQQCRIQ